MSKLIKSPVHNHNIGHYLLTIIWCLFKSLPVLFLACLLAVGGYLIWNSNRQPYNLVFGLPLALIGLGFAVNALWTVILSIFSPAFNRGACILVKRSAEED